MSFNTLLCAPVISESIEDFLLQVAKAKSQGANCIEWRADLLDDAGLISTGLASSSLPVVLTRRASWEGGHCLQNEEQRQALLKAVLEESSVLPYAIDVEWRGITDKTAQNWEAVLSAYIHAGVKVIASWHDFDNKPSHLADIVDAIQAHDLPLVPKLAWKAESVADLADVAELYAHAQQPAVFLAMGEMGVPSRVMAPKWGALLTFARIDGDEGTAPGQPTLADMHAYGFARIDEDTRLYGVVGWPVSHSLSPLIHQAHFNHVQTNAVYLSLAVEPETFAPVFDRLRTTASIDLSGLSVTLPHKQALVNWGRAHGMQLSELVASMGTANTYWKDSQSVEHIENTDVQALLHGIRLASEDSGFDWCNQCVAIVGNGGVAAAAAYGCMVAGAAVTIYGRTLEKAQALANDIGCYAAHLEDLTVSDASVLVQCTPVGMHPNHDQSPLLATHPLLRAGVVVYDTIYTPDPTLLVQYARAAGAKAACGGDMFINQAAAQAIAFTGEQPDIQVWRELLNA